MSNKNGESRLWQKVKKGLTDCFLTRIESSTINGIPDIHAVMNSEIFWIELKSDSLSYPKLNKWQIVWINKYIRAGGKESLETTIFEKIWPDGAHCRNLQVEKPFHPNFRLKRT